ncbi:MAG: small subunit ribosomal protein [Phycisphaerales bacterium]|jgi:small subunit ribosomal protein S5|nr:small subunit ribosomal protein [Phycisphaerales bacterium]
MAEENAQPTGNTEAPAAAAPQAPEAAPAAEGQSSPVPPTAPGSQQQSRGGGGGHGGGGHGGGGGGRGGGRGGPGGGRGRGGPGGRGGRDRDRDESGMESAVVRIYRCAKVVKGGRTFSFGALVVAGDRKGNVGIGYGKANEVPMAVEKATKDARKSLVKVNLKGTTIPHTVKGTSGASTVVLVPARPGTGVTAGKSVRPCVELAGITDILTKAYGSTSPKNLVKATMAALAQLQNRDQVEGNRGVQLEKGAGELVTA